MKKLMIGALAMLSLNILAQPLSDLVVENIVEFTCYHNIKETADLLEEMASDPDYVQNEETWVQKILTIDSTISEEGARHWHERFREEIGADQQILEAMIPELQAQIVASCIACHWNLDGINDININKVCSDLANNVVKIYRAAATVAEKVKKAKNMMYEEAQGQLAEQPTNQEKRLVELSEQATNITQEEAQTILSEETQEQSAEQQKDQTL
ncbi:hypothetical protein KJZ61_02865 [Candidatus Dependentiae bacterium]|nr:hypothetical protein [Candidatus Dependentiae bacterium]